MNWLSIFRGAPKAQAATVPVGGYEGAQAYSIDRSYIFPSTLEEATNPAPYARHELLRLVRYMVNNYAVVERILTVAENYGVGAGVLAQAATSNSEFNDASTSAFDLWASGAFASTNNELNLFDIQKLCMRELLIAGEIFLVMSKSANGYPQLTPVASENVRSTGKKNDKSVDGLFIDSIGKVTAYQIFTGKTYSIVDASNVIHLKRIKTVDQRRGVSAFAASLNSLRDHRDLQNIERTATKLHASLAVAVTKKSGEAGNGTFGNVTPVQTVKGGRAVANRGLDKAFKGATAYLSEGESIELLSSNRSTDGFLKFLVLLMRDVCLNLSLPYEFVVDPSALTGPGIRFVIQDADVLFKNLQNILIDGGLNRIYGWVTASFIKAGRLPKGQEADYYLVSWTRPASVTIDSQRVSNTEIALVQNSLLTFNDYYGNRGQDWKAALRQKAIEEKYLNDLAAEFGIEVSRLRTLPAGAPAVAEPAQEAEPVADDEEEQKAA